MLTSIDYPAMVTTAQCQCMIIPAQPIEELNIQVQLRRSDRTTDCSRTQMTIVYHNLSSIICPTVDGQLMSGGNKNNRSSMTISLSLTKNDRPVITMWNTHLEFINAQVIITSKSQDFCSMFIISSWYVFPIILFTCLNVSYGVGGSPIDWLHSLLCWQAVMVALGSDPLAFYIARGCDVTVLRVQYHQYADDVQLHLNCHLSDTCMCDKCCLSHQFGTTSMDSSNRIRLNRTRMQWARLSIVVCQARSKIDKEALALKFSDWNTQLVICATGQWLING